MSCNSLIYMENSGLANFQANQVIPVGNIIRKYGKNINSNGNGVNVCGVGYYLAIIKLTITPTAAGNFTVQLIENGNAIPGAFAGATGTANEAITLTFNAVVRTNCCEQSKTLNVKIVEGSGTLVGMTTTVLKI